MFDALLNLVTVEKPRVIQRAACGKEDNRPSIKTCCFSRPLALRVCEIDNCYIFNIVKIACSTKFRAPNVQVIDRSFLFRVFIQQRLDQNIKLRCKTSIRREIERIILNYNTEDKEELAICFSEPSQCYKTNSKTAPETIETGSRV